MKKLLEHVFVGADSRSAEKMLDAEKPASVELRRTWRVKKPTADAPSAPPATSACGSTEQLEIIREEEKTWRRVVAGETPPTTATSVPAAPDLIACADKFVGQTWKLIVTQFKPLIDLSETDYERTDEENAKFSFSHWRCGNRERGDNTPPDKKRYT